MFLGKIVTPRMGCRADGKACRLHAGNRFVVIACRLHAVLPVLAMVGLLLGGAAPALAQQTLPDPSPPASTEQPAPADPAQPTAPAGEDPAGADPSASPTDGSAESPAENATAGPLPMPPMIPNQALPHDLSAWGMFMGADIVVKAVMIGLAFASLLTWTVCLVKFVELLAAWRRARREHAALRRVTVLGTPSPELARRGGPVAAFALAASEEIEASAGIPDGPGLQERVQSRLQRIETAAMRRMGRGTGLLATIGSTAPFVGLFGTVWGIMNSFIGISESQTTNLAVVAPGIAEALLATALGLVAAIPAVIVYNVFARAMAGYRLVLGDAAATVLRTLSRNIDARAARGVRAA